MNEAVLENALVPFIRPTHARTRFGAGAGNPEAHAGIASKIAMVAGGGRLVLTV